MCPTYEQLRLRFACELSHDFRKGIGPDLAREPTPPRRDEKFLQAVWHHRLLRSQELVSASGKRIEILDPGRWNHEAGPDFRDARMRIEGRDVVGDVEIHVKASDWQRHQHGRDFEYNRVVLHAFLDHDDCATHDVLHSGRQIERVCLADQLAGDMSSLEQAIELEELEEPVSARGGACQQVLLRLDVGFVRKFFDAAARQRMEQKMQRVANWARHDAPDQVLYQTLLTALGHKSNRTLYYLLARRVPIEELRDITLSVPSNELALALESILLHVAGLVTLPAEAAMCTGPPLDLGTRQYIETLSRHWSQLGGYVHDRTMGPTPRWFAGIRPASFPQRRIAGFVRILCELKFHDSLVDGLRYLLAQSVARTPKSQRDWRREIAALTATFAPDGASYWHHRFTLGGKPTKHATKLIGADTARHLAFNAALPFLLSDARMRGDASAEAHLWRIHDLFPALEPNAISRFMHKRILKGLPAGAVDLRHERTQQALMHLFYDCCQGDMHDCSRCGLLREPVSNQT
jgi:hypothetical protein